jgi:hypothetical protein
MTLTAAAGTRSSAWVVRDVFIDTMVPVGFDQTILNTVE